MSAPLDPVNKPPKPAVVGGRHKPPADNLTGRSGACRILGIDKRELRRLEQQGVLQPAVLQPNGVRWFDIDAVWRLAVERQKAGKKQQRRARRTSRRPEGVERVTGAETRQITEWFAAGLSHAEIVVKSGKTHETIRYLYAQYITPSGARLRMTAPSSAAPTVEPTGYFPEHEPSPTAGRPRRVGPLPAPPSLAMPGPIVSAAPAPQPQPAALPATGRRPLTQVPSSWFTDPLPPLPDEDDNDGAASRRAP
jgi:hypothetical protein